MWQIDGMKDMCLTPGGLMSDSNIVVTTNHKKSAEVVVVMILSVMDNERRTKQCIV